MPSPSPSTVTGLIALALASLMLAPVAAPDASGGGSADRQGDIYLEPGLEYVAVAPAHLARYLQPLVEWKMDRGVPAQIFNLDQIRGSYSGRDGAERLHNFLQDLYYNETEGTPRWLLLAGDSDQVPVRYLWANRDHSNRTTWEDNLFVGDTYYSGLGSDWDADGDGVFGEPGEEDITPELFVGRIAASIPEELENAVAKTLDYELSPQSGDWFQNAFLAGALMDEPNRLDDPYTLPGSSGFSDEGFDPYTDNAYEVTQKVRAVMGEDYDIVELVDYPFFEGCRYNASVDTLSRASSKAAWNRGNAFVFMACHGYEAFGGLAQYEGTGTSGMFESASPFIVWSDTIVNTTGGMLPLVYISSCYAGQFDKEDPKSFETMLTVREGGAIALVAGDGETFRLENISHRSFGNWWLSERFWHLVVREGLSRPGEALYTLKRQYHEYYLTEGPPPTDRINMDYFYVNLYSYNLQGDPEVPVWLGTPSHLDLEVLGGAVFNSPMVRLRVTDAGTGEPVEGATVHARGAGLQGLLEATTDAQGVAVIPRGPTVMGEGLRMTATLDGWVPDREVVVVDEGVRDLSIADADLVGPNVTDFNGSVETFRATVSNPGDFTATSVTVLFDSGDTNAPGEGGVHGRYLTRSVDLLPGGRRTLEFQHTYAAPGEYDPRVTVDPEDGFPEDDELNNEAACHITVRQLPALPESVGPFNVTAGHVHTAILDLDDAVIFANGPPHGVGFALGGVSEGVGAWIDPDHLLHVRPAITTSGTGSVEVWMHFEGRPSDTMTVLLNIVGRNLPPVIAPIPDQEVEAGQVLVVPVNASDPEGGAVTLVTSLPGASFEDGELRWDSRPWAPGEHFPHIRATDGQGNTVETRFRLTIASRNSVPVLQGLDRELEVEEGGRVQVVVTGVDADGDRLTYLLASSDEGYVLDPVTGVLTFDAGDLGPGTYRALLEVSDGRASSTQDLVVEVKASPSPPAPVLLVVGLVLVASLFVLLALRRQG